VARNRNVAVIIFPAASVNKWACADQGFCQNLYDPPIAGGSNDYRSSFVSLVCRYYRRRDRREGLRMATGRPLRALHQAERLEQVGAVPAIPLQP
jgi:hypothetical protein